MRPAFYLVDDEYIRVISKVDDELTKHSCDFHLLEEAYKQWLD